MTGSSTARFRDLQKALAIYAAPKAGSSGKALDNPIENKQALVEALRTLIADAAWLLREQRCGCGRDTASEPF